MNEIHDVCNSCGNEKTLIKIPTSFNYSKAPQKEQRVGTLVNEVIEQSKKDIEEVKQELKDRTHGS